MIGRNQASRARHVPRNDVRIAGDIFSHMASHEARIDVGRPCGRITDDEVDCLAAIEFFDRLSAGGSGDSQGDRQGVSERLRAINGPVSVPTLSKQVSDGDFGIADLQAGHVLASNSEGPITFCASKQCAMRGNPWYHL